MTVVYKSCGKSCGKEDQEIAKSSLIRCKQLTKNYYIFATTIFKVEKLTNCFMVMKKLAQEKLREPSSVVGV